MKASALRALIADIPDDQDIFVDVPLDSACDACKWRYETYLEISGIKADRYPMGSPTGPITTISYLHLTADIT